MDIFRDEAGNLWDGQGNPLPDDAIETARASEAGAMAAEDVGPVEAALIGAGKTFTNIGESLGLRDVPAAEKAYYGELQKQRPISTLVGETLPTAYLPGGPTAQVAGGSILGALENPDNMATGAMLGGGGALAGEVVGRSLARMMKGRAVVEPTSDRARRFTDLGGEITPGQAFEQAEGLDKLTAPVGSRRMEAGFGSAPVSGGRIAALKARNQAQGNRLAARAIGQDADLLTPDVLDDAAEALGDEFDRLEGLVGNLSPSDTFTENMKILPTATRKALQKELDSTGEISADTLHKLNFRKVLRRLKNSQEAKVSLDAEQMMDEYMDLVEESLTGDEVMDFRVVRERWKNLMALESGSAVEPGGNVNYRSLFNQLKKSYDRRGATNALEETRDLYEYSRLAGSREFLDVVGDSGTGTRTNLANPWGWAMGAAGTGYMMPQRGLLDPLAASAGRQITGGTEETE